TSAVGGAVALGDLDGNGLPDDVCYVETRTNQVIIGPLATQRYVPFALAPPTGLVYDARTMAPMGTLLGDFNEDGLLDVLVYYWGRTPLIYLQDKSGSTLDAERFTAHELIAPGPDGKPLRWFTN